MNEVICIIIGLVVLLAIIYSINLTEPFANPAQHIAQVHGGQYVKRSDLERSARAAAQKYCPVDVDYNPNDYIRKSEIKAMSSQKCETPDMKDYVLKSTVPPTQQCPPCICPKVKVSAGLCKYANCSEEECKKIVQCPKQQPCPKGDVRVCPAIKIPHNLEEIANKFDIGKQLKLLKAKLSLDSSSITANERAAISEKLDSYKKIISSEGFTNYPIEHFQTEEEDFLSPSETTDFSQIFQLPETSSITPEIPDLSLITPEFPEASMVTPEIPDLSMITPVFPETQNTSQDMSGVSSEYLNNIAQESNNNSNANNYLQMEEEAPMPVYKNNNNMNILPEEVVNNIQPEESLINKPFREVAEEEQRNNSQLPEEIVSLINNIKQNNIPLVEEEESVRVHLNELNKEKPTIFDVTDVSPSEEYSTDCKPMNYRARFNNYGLLGSIHN